jgi:hypothetical protein
MGMRSQQAAGSRQPAAGKARPSVEIEIEELVLHGFAPGDRYAIAAAVQRELARVLADRGVPRGWAQGLDAARLDAGAFDVALGGSADAIGAQVAGAVYGGLSTAKS